MTKYLVQVQTNYTEKKKWPFLSLQRFAPGLRSRLLLPKPFPLPPGERGRIKMHPLIQYLACSQQIMIPPGLFGHLPNLELVESRTLLELTVPRDIWHPLAAKHLIYSSSSFRSDSIALVMLLILLFIRRAIY